jgi:hypothetical protein
MRKLILTIAVVGMLLVCGTQAASAHGFGHRGYAGRYAPGAYRGAYWGGYPRYYGAGYLGGYGACGPGYAGYGGSPYGYGYGYGYPAPGLGVAGRNFSFWLHP